MKRRMAYGDVTMAEVRAYFPGLTAAAEASMANSVDPETAEWLDGPGFVRWIRDHGMRTDDMLGKSVARNIYRWRRGAAVGIDSADRILDAIGHHLNDLPDHVWRNPPSKLRTSDLTPAKREAVRRIRNGERVLQVAEDVGASERAVRLWMKKAA